MRTKIIHAWIYLTMILLSVLMLLPLLITFTNSFMPEAEIGLGYTAKRSIFEILEGITEKFTGFRIIPRELTFSQYTEILFFQPSFLRLLGNSLKLTVPVVLGNVLVSLLSAYGFTIWKWRFKEFLFFTYIVVMLLPLQAVLVPNYIIADRLHLTNTYWAIILPGIFSPFGAFLMRQSLKGLPTAYFEAAKMDGANTLQILFRIVLPQMKSSVAALAMLVFIEYWNLVEQSILFIKDYYREPLSVYLSRMSDGRIGLIFAASCLYMFIPLWFLLMGQENLEKGIELSGVK